MDCLLFCGACSAIWLPCHRTHCATTVSTPLLLIHVHMQLPQRPALEMHVASAHVDIVTEGSAVAAVALPAYVWHGGMADKALKNPLAGHWL